MSSVCDINPVTSLKGSPRIPGDKSISHRALILGAIAQGKTEITHLLDSADVNSTWSCLEALGVSIQKQGNKICVNGRGLNSLHKSSTQLDCGNSGTTIRLLMGLLAGQNFDSVLVGDASLSQRPMQRVREPLMQMGAEINLHNYNYAPIQIKARHLKAVNYALPIASAQVKSALMLAALFCPETTRLSGLIHSRDHSERMFELFGANIQSHQPHPQPLSSNWRGEKNQISSPSPLGGEGSGERSPIEILITGNQNLKACDLIVPGDPSTAAFWIAAATIVPNSEIELEEVSLNPTRLGFLNALQKMGAHIETEIISTGPEPIGNLRIKSSNLQAISLKSENIPALIDEIPILAIVCTQAHGVSEVRGAEELKVKESNRLQAIADNLRSMGVEIELLSDGFRIQGPQTLKGALINSHEDHRIAMAFSIAGLIAQGTTQISHPECVQISYPNFFDTLRDLSL